MRPGQAARGFSPIAAPPGFLRQASPRSGGSPATVPGSEQSVRASAPAQPDLDDEDLGCSSPDTLPRPDSPVGELPRAAVMTRPAFTPKWLSQSRAATVVAPTARVAAASVVATQLFHSDSEGEDEEVRGARSVHGRRGKADGDDDDEGWSEGEGEDEAESQEDDDDDDGYREDEEEEASPGCGNACQEPGGCRDGPGCRAAGRPPRIPSPGAASPTGSGGGDSLFEVESDEDGASCGSGETIPAAAGGSDGEASLGDDEEGAGSGGAGSGSDCWADDDDDDGDDDFEMDAGAAVTPPRSAAAVAVTVQKPLGPSGKRAAVERAFAEFNARVFDGALPEGMAVTWNKRLRTTAGLTYTSRRAVGDEVVRRARIELAEKVLTDAHRVRSTLLHEMCHAAAWIVDGVAKPPHGAVFRRWAARASGEYPQYSVKTCHAYEIQYRHRWRCVGCAADFGRHSKSIDTDKQRCGACGGKLEYQAGTNADGTPARPRKATAFSAFVGERYRDLKADMGAGATHGAVMRALSAEWKERKAAQAAGGAGTGDELE